MLWIGPLSALPAALLFVCYSPNCGPLPSSPSSLQVGKASRFPTRGHASVFLPGRTPNTPSWLSFVSRSHPSRLLFSWTQAFLLFPPIWTPLAFLSFPDLARVSSTRTLRTPLFPPSVVEAAPPRTRPAVSFLFPHGTVQDRPPLLIPPTPMSRLKGSLEVTPAFSLSTLRAPLTTEDPFVYAVWMFLLARSPRLLFSRFRPPCFPSSTLLQYVRFRHAPEYAGSVVNLFPISHLFLPAVPF